MHDSYPHVECRLRRVYHFIVHHCRETNGLPPTFREIAGACDLGSSSTAHKYVKTLAGRGVLELHGDTEWRSISVVGAQWEPPITCPQCETPHTVNNATNGWRRVWTESHE